MIIYSWNMLFENERLQEALSFIQANTFDVFCLQEVPMEFLTQLRLLPYNIASIEELQVVSVKRSFPIYSVILTPHAITGESKVVFSDRQYPLRTKIVRFMLTLLQKERIKKWYSHTSQYADIFISGKSIRVFNLHLPLNYPHVRMEELTTMLQNIKDKENTIVCGDFNILGTFYISVLNYLLGGRLRDWFLYKEERSKMEQVFKEKGLINPLKGKSTHPLSQSQLDHILVPESFSVKEATVICNRHGSDHNPIRVVAE